MKKIKNKIAALVCGLALLCGVTYTASAACYRIDVYACGNHFGDTLCGITLDDAVNHGKGIASFLCSRNPSIIAVN